MTVLLIVHDSEYNEWRLLIRTQQECEICRQVGGYVAHDIKSDGDTVPNCLFCLREQHDFTEMVIV